jgi:hypothetical protein
MLEYLKGIPYVEAGASETDLYVLGCVAVFLYPRVAILSVCPDKQ